MLAAAATGRARRIPAAGPLPPSTRPSPLLKRPPSLLLKQTAAKAQQGGNGGNGGNGGDRGASSSSFPLAQLATIAAALALGATALATDPDLLDGGGTNNSNNTRRTKAEEASLLKQWRGQRTAGAAAFSSSSSSSQSSSSVPSTLMIATVDGQPFALDADLVPGGAEALRRSAAAAEAEAELGQQQQPTALSASAVLSASPAIASSADGDDGSGRPKQQPSTKPTTTTTKRRLALLAARFSPGDATAAAMWSVAYWFVSPAQLLVIFLGRIEPERSSAWLVRAVGLVPALLICGLGGLATAVLSSAAFGSATWAVAGGLGALAAAGFIEIGRPRELGEGEQRRWLRRRREFGAWAAQRLTAASAARCHEREILAAFRRDAVARRAARRARRLRRREEEAEAGVAAAAVATTTSEDEEEEEEDDDDAAWDEETIRDLVRAWAGPGAERSRSGYWRGVGLATAAAAAAAVDGR